MKVVQKSSLILYITMIILVLRQNDTTYIFSLHFTHDYDYSFSWNSVVITLDGLAFGQDRNSTFCHFFLVQNWGYFGAPAVWTYPNKMARLIGLLCCLKKSPWDTRQIVILKMSLLCLQYVHIKEKLRRWAVTQFFDYVVLDTAAQNKRSK